MSYTKNVPVYEAYQWTGDNTQEILDLCNQWFFSYGYTNVYEPENERIMTASGYEIKLNDWVVTAGMWPGTPHKDGGPEVCPAILFPVKYAELVDPETT